MAAQRSGPDPDGSGEVAERIPIEFAGYGAGAGPLSWGQQALWETIRRNDTWLPVGVVLPLPAGTTLDDAVADLRFVMNSYPSMRTRLILDPGSPIQLVSGSGRIELEVVDATGDDPVRAANRTWWRFCGADYDFENDWPLRTAVVRHRGRLTHRIWTMCHLANDGAGGRVVIEELAGRDASGSRGCLTPLAQARWQASPAGQRQCHVALRHWERALRHARPRPPEPRGGITGPRWWQGRSESPATHLAVRAISARTGVESSSVLLALFAIAHARVTGVNPVVLQVAVSNRFRTSLARSVSPVMQDGVCVVEIPDGTVDDAVRVTRRRAIAGYKNAYYDPRGREELVARIGRDLGAEPDLGLHFNDRRFRNRDQAGPAPEPERIRAEAGNGSFRWLMKQDEMVLDDVYYNVEDLPDRVMVTVTLDAAYVSPQDVEATLWELERVAVTAALEPDTRTEVPAAVPAAVPAG